jgi:hypothetical protein
VGSAGLHPGSHDILPGKSESVTKRPAVHAAIVAAPMSLDRLIRPSFDYHASRRI